MGFLIEDAVAQVTPAPGAGAPPGMGVDFWIFMGIMLAVMYWMIIRPQRKRQKEHESLLTNLGKGDEVVMTCGILGKIVKMEGDYVLVTTGKDIELRFQKSSVHAVLPKGTIKQVLDEK